MKPWKPEQGVDQKKAEALSRGVAKKPEWFSNAYETLSKAIAPKSAADTKPEIKQDIRKYR